MENETEAKKLEFKEACYNYFLCEIKADGTRIARITVARCGPKVWEIRTYTRGGREDFFYSKPFRGSIDEAQSEAILFFHKNMEALENHEESTN